MKFLDQHRNQLFKIMESHGFTSTDFNYIKRRGRIHIYYQEKYFSYLRIKSTRLHPENKAWINSESFKIQTQDSKEKEVNDWNELLKGFQNWISALKHK